MYAILVRLKVFQSVKTTTLKSPDLMKVSAFMFQVPLEGAEVDIA